MSFDLRKFANFAPNLLGMFGVNVVLPGVNGDDPTIIRAVFPRSQEAVVDEYSNITYQEYALRIPPDGLGTLEDGTGGLASGAGGDHPRRARRGPPHVLRGQPGPADLGWWVATLQDHSPGVSPGNGQQWQSL